MMGSGAACPGDELIGVDRTTSGVLLDDVGVGVAEHLDAVPHLVGDLLQRQALLGEPQGGVGVPQEVGRGRWPRRRQGHRAVTDSWLRHPDLVRLRAGRYSTGELIETENELLATAERRRGTDVAIAPESAVANAIARRPSISQEQTNLVRRLVSFGDGVQVVRAAAGTGKTFALAAAHDAWRSDDIAVEGCVLAARAALELRDQTGIPSTTIADRLARLREGVPIARGGVLVVDEAGMVGTRDLAELSAHAEAAGAKLVLVGDDRQLPEIEAGGAFAAIADRLTAVELHEVRRQRHVWDRDALARLRDGDSVGFVETYRSHGRVIAAANAEQLRARIVEDWWRDCRANPNDAIVMVALRRADVADLNDRAREELRRAGRLGSEQVEVGRAAFATGDRVVAVRNDRPLGLANGTPAVVSRVDIAAGALTIATTDGSIELPARYLEAGGIEHGYAMTAHRLQGATVDRSYVLGSEELYREWGYSALTRHRDKTLLYTVSTNAQLPLPGLAAPDDGLTRALAQSRSNDLANAELRFGVERQSTPCSALAEPIAEARELHAAIRQLAAAEERHADTERQLASTGRLRTRRRDELQRLRTSQECAVEYWQWEADRLHRALDDAGRSFDSRELGDGHETRPLDPPWDSANGMPGVRVPGAPADLPAARHDGPDGGVPGPEFP